jgi:DNA-binding NtrC family response regulator
MGALPSDYRILVIDDEIPVLEVMTDILAGVGWSVDAYRSPLEALTHVKGGRYDALVLDLYMQELSGLLVYAHVSFLDHELASRTVFVSGHLTSEDLARALCATPRFLPKPFRAEALTGMVGMALPDTPRRLTAGLASDRRDGTSSRS